MVRASEKNVCESLVDFDICHRMVSLRNNTVILTYFFKVQIFFNISETVGASAKKHSTFTDLDLCDLITLTYFKGKK